MSGVVGPAETCVDLASMMIANANVMNEVVADVVADAARDLVSDAVITAADRDSATVAARRSARRRCVHACDSARSGTARDAMIPWRRRDLRCCGWEPQLLRSTMHARAGSVLRVATKGTLVGLVRARVAGAPRSDILQSLGLFVCWVGSPMHCRCTAAETI